MRIASCIEYTFKQVAQCLSGLTTRRSLARVLAGQVGVSVWSLVTVSERRFIQYNFLFFFFTLFTEITLFNYGDLDLRK